MNNFDEKKKEIETKTTKVNLVEEVEKVKEAIIYILEILKTRNF